MQFEKVTKPTARYRTTRWEMPPICPRMVVGQVPLCIQTTLYYFTVASYMVSCLLFPAITEKAFIVLTAWMRKQSQDTQSGPRSSPLEAKCSAVGSLPWRPVKTLCGATSLREQCCLCDRLPEGFQVSVPLPHAPFDLPQQTDFYLSFYSSICKTQVTGPNRAQVTQPQTYTLFGSYQTNFASPN